MVAQLVWMFGFTKWVKLLGLFRRHPEDIIFLPVSILFGWYHGFIKLYALFTLNMVSVVVYKSASTSNTFGRLLGAAGQTVTLTMHCGCHPAQDRMKASLRQWHVPTISSICIDVLSNHHGLWQRRQCSQLTATSSPQYPQSPGSRPIRLSANPRSRSFCWTRHHDYGITIS